MAEHTSTTKATTLFEFYQQKGEKLPSIPERSKVFEQFGLGSASLYQGSFEQNVLLLEKLQASPDTAPTRTPTPTATITPTAPQFSPVGGVGPTYTDPTSGATFRFNEQGKWVQISTGAIQPISTVAPTVSPAPADVSEATREKAAADANATAQTIFDSIVDQDDEGPPTRKSSEELILGIQEKIEEKPPEAPDLRTLFNEEMAKLGLDVDQEDLAKIDAEIDRIKNRALSAGVLFEEKAATGEGDVVITTAQVRAKQTELNRQAQIDINLLSVERSAIARMVQNKLTTLSLVMEFSQIDFENASQVYKSEFDRNIQLYNIINDKEEAEKTREEKAQDSAISNLIIVHNLLKANNLDYASLTVSQKLNIEQLEIQGGLPVGITAQIMAEEPDKKVKSVRGLTDVSGNTFFEVLLEDKDGNLSIKTLRGSVQVKIDTEGLDPVLLKDLQDAVATIDAGADQDLVKRRFLEHHKDEGKLFDQYIGF